MWGAHEADGRIAARNATKIRAALQNSLNAKQVFENYLTTQPAISTNQAQDRARARSWALLHLRLNNEALKQALLRLYAEAWVTGKAAAEEEVNIATREQKKSFTIIKSDIATIDWSKWEPGDAASAMLLDPPKAFQDLVESSGALIKGLDNTGYELVGTALADSIRLGLSPAKAAKIINLQIGNPARALTIAVTESSRVMNASAINRYKEMGIEQVKWMPVLSVVGGGKACDQCAENTGQIVTMGSSFNSGVTQPPQHPHCRCNLLPVIPDYANMPNDVIDVAPVVPAQVPVFSTPKQQIEQTLAELHAPKPVGDTPEMLYRQMDMRGYEPGNWEIVPREVMQELAIQNSMRSVYNMTRQGIESFFTPNRISKADKALVEKGIVYKNGRIEVQFASAGLKTTEAQRQMLLEKVDQLQILNPKDRAVVHIDKNSSTKYGWAYGGKSDLWVTPKVVQVPDFGMTERGGFKMPVTEATTQLEYTLTHEWGHLIDDIYNGDHSLQRSVTIGKIQDAYPDEFRSRYSKTNDKEFFAEMFTEYVNTKGETPNKMVQAMAKEFGWKAPAPKVAPIASVAFPINPPKAKTLKNLDKNNVIEISKIKDSFAEPVKIWNGSDKEYQTLYRPVGDPRLKALLEEQGFTKTPTVVNAEQYEVLVQQGGIKVYRGVTETTNLSAAQMIEQFKNGDMFVGTGVVGNGVYSGTDLNYVIKYAGDKPENVMEMILSPKAKFIDAKDAEEGARALSGAFYDAAFGRAYANPELGKIVDSYIKTLGPIPGSGEAATVYREKLRELGWLYHDPGAYAAAHGYDAIRHIDEDGGVFVILNRGAVVVKE
jgi:SPP1 gp7 family putative phage head morphogenesis protein